MSNKKQTAVDWLFLMLNNPNSDQEFAKKIYDKAKEMEREQIVEARENGIYVSNKGYGVSHEEYYTETYETA